MSTPHLSNVTPLDDRVTTKDAYEQALVHAQEQLLHIQQALYQAGERVVLVFEGTDASGKGGIIRRTTQLLDPRGFRVHAVGKPTPDEQGRHYLWRFFRHLPPPGRIAIFDRSWYGRLLVERVEHFAAEHEWQRAFGEIVEFERWLTDDGVRLVKVFLHIDRDEQAQRFEARLSDPRKYWKLTEEDLRNRRNWDHYIEATNDMFARTHTTNAPWHLVDARRKWQARLYVLELLTTSLSRGLIIDPPALDPELLRQAREELGLKLADVLPPKDES